MLCNAMKKEGSQPGAWLEGSGGAGVTTDRKVTVKSQWCGVAVVAWASAFPILDMMPKRRQPPRWGGRRDGQAETFCGREKEKEEGRDGNLPSCLLFRRT